MAKPVIFLEEGGRKPLKRVPRCPAYNNAHEHIDKSGVVFCELDRGHDGDHQGRTELGMHVVAWPYAEMRKGEPEH